jgi:hypothetical protein
MTASIQLGRNDGGAEFFNGTATTGQTTLAVQTTLVAAATTATGGLNVVVPIAGSTAFVLPKGAQVGSPIVIINLAATAVTLLVFPPWDNVANAAAGGKINGGTANASFSIAQNGKAVFYPNPNGVDFTAILSA